MAEANPEAMQATVEVTNLKALAEFTNQLIAAYNTITINSSQNFTTSMDAMNKQMVANLDFANKIMNTRLEIDPIEAAATAIILQQATKTAQTTPPETGKPS